MHTIRIATALALGLALHVSTTQAAYLVGSGRSGILIGMLGSDVLLGGPGDDVLVGGIERGSQPNSDIQIGDTGKLPVLENSVWNAQAAHEGVLRRRHIEQAVKAPAEIVRRRRRRVALGLRLQTFIGIERMLLALEFLGIGQLLALADKPVLSLEAGGVRTDRLGIDLAGWRVRSGGDADAPADAPDLQAGHEAFQIPLLFVAKIG